MQLSLIDIPGREPLPEQSLVHRDMLEHPVVREIVETPRNVAFEYPLSRCFPAEKIEALFDCIGGGSIGTKPVGIRIRRLCCDG